jgi:hypothetical protein
MTLNNVTGIQNKPGIVLINRVTPGGVENPAASREFVAFTGVSGSTLTGLTRNADSGSSDQDHAIGSVVEFVSDALAQQAIIDAIVAEHSTLGVHDVTKVVTPAGTQTLTNKTLTAPVINSATGTSDGFTSGITKAFKSATTTVDVSAATAPSAGQVLTATTDSAATWQTPSGNTDGWTAATGSWTYASASTITVPSGAASLYQKGDRIKWTQTTVKYGVIVGVADTLLTIAVNTGYVVTNAVISANYYSHQLNPIGYPHWFPFTSTFSKKGNKATFVGKFNVDRTDFGVGVKGNEVAETLKITATIHATKN